MNRRAMPGFNITRVFDDQQELVMALRGVVGAGSRRRYAGAIQRIRSETVRDQPLRQRDAARP